MSYTGLSPALLAAIWSPYIACAMAAAIGLRQMLPRQTNRTRQGPGWGEFMMGLPSLGRTAPLHQLCQ